MGTLGYGKRRLVDKIVAENWGKKDSFTYNEMLYLMQETLDEEGRPYLEEQYSVHRGFAIYRAFVQHLLYRNLANFDSMLLVTGEKGMSKSSCSMMIAREWCKLLGIRFSPERHIAYSNADVLRKVDSLNPFEPIICLTGTSRVKIRVGNVESMININKLIGRYDYDILSYDKENDIFEYVKPAGCVHNGKSDEIFEIVLENGLKLRATCNHLFLLKSGEYRRLDELREGDDIVVGARI